MDTLQMIAMLAVFILVLLFAYFLFNKEKTLTTGIRDGQKYYVVDTNDLGITDGLVTELAVSIWIYVSDWTKSGDQDRIVLYIGPDSITAGGTENGGNVSNGKLESTDTDYVTNYIHGDSGTSTESILPHSSDTQSSMVLWLDSDDPILCLGVSQGTTPDKKFQINSKHIEIRNFPLQKWVCVTYSIYGNSLDLYLNGKLVKSVVDDDVTLMMSESALVALGNPWYNKTVADDEITITNLTAGFKGYTSKLKYYKSALTPKEAYNIYKSGPGTSYLGDILGDRSVNINFMDGDDVTRSFNF